MFVLFNRYPRSSISLAFFVPVLAFFCHVHTNVQLTELQTNPRSKSSSGSSMASVGFANLPKQWHLQVCQTRSSRSISWLWENQVWEKQHWSTRCSTKRFWPRKLWNRLQLRGWWNSKRFHRNDYFSNWRGRRQVKFDSNHHTRIWRQPRLHRFRETYCGGNQHAVWPLLGAESRVNRSTITDNRVHALLYFIEPTGHSLKALDIQVMKQVHEKVNLIPIITKSDTLTDEEIADFKASYSSWSYSPEDQDFQTPDIRQWRWRGSERL